MLEDKNQKTNDPIEKVADGFDDFKLFLKKKEIQNEVLKKIIEKPEFGSANKKK